MNHNDYVFFQTNLILFLKFKGMRSLQNKQCGSRQVTTTVEGEVLFSEIPNLL
jgi:hypothetical protein